MTLNRRVEIVVGIIRSQSGHIFITQRGEHAHLAGCWEFPGGKIEQHETLKQALSRELAEEVGIQMHDATFLKTVHHDYGDRYVVMHVYFIEQWDGNPFGREGQNGRWLLPSELNTDDFPHGNRLIIEMLKNAEKMS